MNQPATVTETKARATLRSITTQMVISNQDELAFMMMSLAGERKREFRNIHHSRLGVGQSRFYKVKGDHR